jgi:hypothetical protein
MKHILKHGAVLLAIVALALMPAAAFANTNHVTSHQVPAEHHSPLAWLFGLGVGVAGTVSVLYSFESGALTTYSSATPPTTTQASLVQEIVVEVNWAIADTQALITHNLQYSASAAGNFFRPQVVGPVWINGPLGGGTNTPFVSFDFTNTSVLKANKLGVAGTEGTYVLYLRRPWSASK